MTVGIVLGIYVMVGVLVAGLLHLVGQRGRVLTPIAFFVGIEIVAVWPTLVPADGGPLETVGLFPALLACVGLLGTAVVYVLLGGSQADALRWRDDSFQPDADALRSLTTGIMILLTALVVLGSINFGGLPPLLNGGLSSLLDPVTNSDQVSLIREARRSRTKGHLLLGEQYAGQGIINAVTEVGWQVVVIGAVLHWTWRRNRSSVVLLIAVSALAFIFLASAGARSPLIICIIAGVAAAALRRRMPSKYVLGTVAAGLSIGLLIMPLSKGAAGGVTLEERATALATRISEGNGQNNAQIVRLISTGSLDLQQGGLLLEQFQVMLPGVNEGIPFTLRLTHLAYGGGSQTTGYATPTQFGLMYADLGTGGVLLGYLFSGALLALGWRRILRVRSPIGAVLAVEGAIILGYLSVTGITGVIAQASVAALLILVLAGPKGWSQFASAVLKKGSQAGTEDRSPARV